MEGNLTISFTIKFYRALVSTLQTCVAAAFWVFLFVLGVFFLERLTNF